MVLLYTTTGYNTSIGNTTGNHNTAVGFICIKLVIAIGLCPTSGNYNTAIGNTSGD